MTIKNLHNDTDFSLLLRCLGMLESEARAEENGSILFSDESFQLYEKPIKYHISCMETCCK